MSSAANAVFLVVDLSKARRKGDVGRRAKNQDIGTQGRNTSYGALTFKHNGIDKLRKFTREEMPKVGEKTQYYTKRPGEYTDIEFHPPKDPKMANRMPPRFRKPLAGREALLNAIFPERAENLARQEREGTQEAREVGEAAREAAARLREGAQRNLREWKEGERADAIEELEGDIAHDKEQLGVEPPEESMEGVLRERVADWDPPRKFRTTSDPKFADELAALLTLRRRVARRLRIQGGARKKQMMGAAPITIDAPGQAKPITVSYAEVDRRINQIVSRKYATEGLRIEIGDRDEILVLGKQALVSDLPFIDFGYAPTDKPMSYLLSVGWHKKDGEGQNEFSANESAALHHEYKGLVRKVNSRLFERYKDMFSDGEKSEAREDLHNTLYLRFMNIAKDWDPALRRRKLRQKREELRAKVRLGDLGAREQLDKLKGFDERDFHSYVTKNLFDEGRMIYNAEADRRKAQVHLGEEELQPMLASGKLAAPHARVAGPEDVAKLRELQQQAERLITSLGLKREEYLSLMGRLGILHARQTGDSEIGTQTQTMRVEQIKERTRQRHVETPEAFKERQKEQHFYTDIEIPGARDWKGAREDIAREVAEQDGISFEEAHRKVLEWGVEGAANRAFDTLRSNKTGMTSEERAILTEYAQEQQKYFSGLRHRHFDPSESVGKLKTEPMKETWFGQTVTLSIEDIDKRLSKLREEHKQAHRLIKRGSLKWLRSSEGKRIQAKKLALSRKMSELNGAKQKLQRPSGERNPMVSPFYDVGTWEQVRAEVSGAHEFDAEAFEYWNRNPQAARAHGLTYASYKVSPGVRAPRRVYQEQVRGKEIYREVVLPRAQQLIDKVKKNPKLLGKLSAEHRKEYESFVVDKEYEEQKQRYKERLEREAKRHETGKSLSFVVPDLNKALDDLQEELLIWELNGV